MHKLKKYWEKVSADPVKIEEMEEIVCEALEEIRGRCPRLFWDTAYKLHCVATADTLMKSWQKRQ